VLAIRVAARVGARDDAVAGATHMFEHLAFRTPGGAAARRLIEDAGGELGAATTREQLAVDVVVLPDELTIAVDALRRILAARPRATELEQERPVVLRELAQEGEERRRVWQLMNEALYGVQHPLARPILGTPASLKALTLANLAATADAIHTGSCAVAACGPVDPSLLTRELVGLVAGGCRPRVAVPAPVSPTTSRRHEKRRSDLLHVAVGWRFGGLADPTLAALRVAEIILAHGSGSRLYERLRTRRRLAYRVSTILVPYADAGHVCVLTAVDPGHRQQAEMAIIGEVERLAAHGPAGPSATLTAVSSRVGVLACLSRRGGSAADASTQLPWGRLTAVDQEQWSGEALTPASVRDACATLVRTGRHAVASVGRSALEATR
jgi:predicted Zn-dependent peptidase